MIIRSLDPDHTGFIEEVTFRKMMASKEGVSDKDVNDMIDGNMNIWIQPAYKSNLTNFQNTEKYNLEMTTSSIITVGQYN